MCLSARPRPDPPDSCPCHEENTPRPTGVSIFGPRSSLTVEGQHTSKPNTEAGEKVMFRKNMGRLDRTVRFVAGAALAATGLFLLDGWRGNPTGIIIAVLATIPLITSLTGFCPGYVPFGIATLKREKPTENAAWCCRTAASVLRRERVTIEEGSRSGRAN